MAATPEMAGRATPPSSTSSSSSSSSPHSPPPPRLHLRPPRRGRAELLRRSPWRSRGAAAGRRETRDEGRGRGGEGRAGKSGDEREEDGECRAERGGAEDGGGWGGEHGKGMRDAGRWKETVVEGVRE
ncbi:unnamed protein product [Lampetra planeri]